MSDSKSKIFVTKSHLPPKDKYFELCSQIWDSGQLTNNGPFVKKLESELNNRFNNNISYVTNGTVAIQIAIKALDLKGEIITTPFSYVATTSSIVWENCTPVFVDIEKEYLSIDPEKIESKITKNTTAILATHVFGNPCDVTKIEQIAAKHNLKVIYDAAHAFDVQYQSKSILDYGDISTLSFHATKIFHTSEGGAVISQNKELDHKIKYLRNFGHNGRTAFHGLGINGKNSEFHAAMGILMLDEITHVKESRKSAYQMYIQELAHLNDLTILKIRPETIWNYSYFPVILKNEELLNKLLDDLKTWDIYPRRYFYPSLNSLPYVTNISCPNSERISATILCLPFYANMENKLITHICDKIKKVVT